MYRDGLGVTIDKAKAMNFFEQASTQGHITAKQDYGMSQYHLIIMTHSPQRNCNPTMQQRERKTK